MNTMESKVPSSAAAPEQSLDQDMWLDTALEGHVSGQRSHCYIPQ